MQSETDNTVGGGGGGGVLWPPPRYLKCRQKWVDKSVKIAAAGATQKFPPKELSAQEGKDWYEEQEEEEEAVNRGHAAYQRID